MAYITGVPPSEEGLKEILHTLGKRISLSTVYQPGLMQLRKGFG